MCYLIIGFLIGSLLAALAVYSLDTPLFDIRYYVDLTKELIDTHISFQEFAVVAAYQSPRAPALATECQNRMHSRSENPEQSLFSMVPSFEKKEGYSKFDPVEQVLHFSRTLGSIGI